MRLNPNLIFSGHRQRFIDICGPSYQAADAHGRGKRQYQAGRRSR
jgi:hypothetical protein